MFSRASSVLSLIALLAKQCLGQAIPDWNGTVSSAETCEFLHSTYPNMTYFAIDINYNTLNTDYFSAACRLGPACIFAPTSAELMSFAVKVLVKAGVQFALRGGGHMPIADANNIDSTGILLASSGLAQLRLSKDKSTVSVGPGNTWGDVYQYLDSAGVSVVGGRLGVVGVPGLLLGGGISFFSNEHGWGSANVKNYEAVLADGEIVTATAENEYSDLFWALRGGGNSFAIVTNFDLKTLEAPVVTVGTVSYGAGKRDEFLDAVYHYAIDGVKDKKSGIIPNCHWLGVSPLIPFYAGFLFYNGNNTEPAALENFTSSTMQPDLSDFRPRSMGEWAEAGDGAWELLKGVHFRFHVFPFRVNREAMGIFHDTFFDLASKHLVSVLGVGATITFMPISESSLSTNRGPDPRGDPMGIDTSQAPFFWVEESILFTLDQDEATITSFFELVNAEIEAKLEPLGVLTSYYYLNDADKNQSVFQGYRRENLERLKEIRDKYDPDMIYTKQMPGGFKVANAP